MKKDQLLLDKILSLNKVCKRIGLHEKLITFTIKKNTKNNWKGSLNNYCTNYTLNLLN